MVRPTATLRLLTILGWILVATDGRGQPTEPLVRLDHIPTAVLDLDSAVADYQALGFAIKPGRAHDDGLRNAHVKFANGAGIELITADRSRDELSARYVDFLHGGEGPAYLSLHTDNEPAAATALQAAGVASTRGPDGLALTDARLNWVFFVRDNRSPTDRPENFEHLNGAFATREVWVALDDVAPLAHLLEALGARGKQERFREPVATQALVFDLADHGRVVIVPAKFQIVSGHPLIAVVLATKADDARPPKWLVPRQSHGFWLELRPEP